MCYVIELTRKGRRQGEFSDFKKKIGLLESRQEITCFIHWAIVPEMQTFTFFSFILPLETSTFRVSSVILSATRLL
jgi:hypothetical protein